jgi:site-specific recombinase XerD
MLKKPTPLYPTFENLIEMNLNEYTSITKLFKEPWHEEHFLWGKSFLEYIGRNKSKNTYDRFRSEVERFILWAILVKDKKITDYKKSDILEYADFCWKPPVNWIGTSNYERFCKTSIYLEANPLWAPFTLQNTKSNQAAKIDKKKYRPSQQTLKSLFTAITVFYNHLMDEEIAPGNPTQIAKKDCKHLIIDSQVREIKRLTDNQWNYMLETAEEMANLSIKYERHLFVVVCLKTLFLRISELSEQPNWSPAMNHFWQDEDENWWLKIFGKGKKLRDVTVPPDFLEYLERYRLSRSLSMLPVSSENCALVEKIRGTGGMSSRHLRRLVQEVFDSAYTRMLEKEGENKAIKLKEASSHWLRHTGASMEVERGRPLKDISEDLGHASMATTDTIYVQTEHKKRAESGKTRSVD